jgi:hypothetical protein
MTESSETVKAPESCVKCDEFYEGVRSDFMRALDREDMAIKMLIDAGVICPPRVLLLRRYQTSQSDMSSRVSAVCWQSACVADNTSVPQYTCQSIRVYQYINPALSRSSRETLPSGLNKSNARMRPRGDQSK